MTTMTEKTTRVTEAQGRFIEQFRAHTNIDALMKAFAQQCQEVEATAFDVLENTTLDTAVGVQLDGLGAIVGVEREGRSDTDYRVRIQAQILRNNSSGTIEELLQLLVALGSASGNVIEELPPAKFSITVGQALVNGATIGAVVATAKPAGVGFWFVWFEGTNPFRFDTAGQGFDQGELAEAIQA